MNRLRLTHCLALIPLAWSLAATAAKPASQEEPKAKAVAQAAADRPSARARDGKSPQAKAAPAKAKAKAQAKAKPEAKAVPRPKTARAGAARAGTAQAGAPSKVRAARAARPSDGAKATPARTASAAQVRRLPVTPAGKAKLDLSGRKRVGQASYYARMFAGRKMADGRRMNPNHHNAASRTLPLGTTAKVTNLKTGKSAVVRIQDRGPYVAGRIVDLSPATARQVGITPKDGIAPVAVTPIEVPLPDGRIKLGEAAGDPMARLEIARAPRDGD